MPNKRYVEEWIVSIADITDFVRDTKKAITEKRISHGLLPVEREYLVLK